MVILLSGATGFIGRVLRQRLLENNHKIYALVRKEKSDIDSGIEQVTIDRLNSIDVEFDVFINLAGENIAAKPWTKKRKQVLYSSRVDLTEEIRKNLKHPPKRVISMSAIGFYGTTSTGIYDENTTPTPSFTHDLCKAWENAALQFSSTATSVVIFRLGVVLGLGGALDKMRLPFKLGLGGPIAGGKQWLSWIHIDDVLKAIMEAMTDSSYNGIYNLVAPQFTDQKSFALNYGQSLKRPAFIPTPKWLMTLLLGEMASLLTEGAKITPYRLEQKGFKFEFSHLDKALKDIEEKYQASS
ncbi:TIGR01777 family oxidoreductase [Marinomonas sp. 2405UD66-6]|uniref:TIGR01777 family oxidoreductase n=1 Tax=Marinomonas sp. 2405UD66-6 TaxID=3391834 RepID=UPI0039C9F59C